MSCVALQSSCSTAASGGGPSGEQRKPPFRTPQQDRPKTSTLMPTSLPCIRAHRRRATAAQEGSQPDARAPGLNHQWAPAYRATHWRAYLVGTRAEGGVEQASAVGRASARLEGPTATRQPRTQVIMTTSSKEISVAHAPQTRSRLGLRRRYSRRLQFMPREAPAAARIRLSICELWRAAGTATRRLGAFTQAP